MQRFVQLLQAIGVNAVPALGFLGAGWSIGTALALYWIENLVSSVLVIARIAIHRRLTRKRGHYKGALSLQPHHAKENELPAKTFLQAYAATAIPFTLVHGVFVFIILRFMLGGGVFGDERLNFDELQTGATATLLILAVGFAADLFVIRSRPFAWIRKSAEYSLGRMMVMHVTIVLGLLAVLMFDAARALFGIFVALKALLDVSSRLPQQKRDEPPRWVAALMSRLSGTRGETYVDFFKRQRREELEREKDDEISDAAVDRST